MPAVSVQTEDFDISQEIAALKRGCHDVGAVVTFTGTVRDMDGCLKAMTLEHYPGMTEKQLKAIVGEANMRWPLQACRVIHRYGRLEPGENIVLVVTMSAHRHAAFQAAEFLMDFLKSRAPFWKNEETKTGTKWVDARESDTKALDRWQQ
ncbi:molybdopterin synthase catalytic subunit MoaE [Kordiimonas sp.]|uniref:molybdopterin synthase catalytic subunit MoaE n=1 Tax=Kordiimonas sp. TaxID=1970157 RepID=UPI003A8E467F